MRNLDQAAASWTAGALVFVQQGEGDAIVRPAAFVFATPGGLAWVEPSYADPMGASANALHERDGDLVDEGLGFVLTTASGERVTVLPYDPEAGDGDLVGGALEWFAEHLAETGQAWESERESVRELISGSR